MAKKSARRKGGRQQGKKKGGAKPAGKAPVQGSAKPEKPKAPPSPPKTPSDADRKPPVPKREKPPAQDREPGPGEKNNHDKEKKDKQQIIKEPPNVLVPLLIYFVFLVVCYGLGYFKLVPRQILFPVFSVGSLAILLYVTTVIRFAHLKSSLGLILVAAFAVLLVAACLIPLLQSADYGEHISQNTLNRGARTLEVNLPEKGGYKLFLEGSFGEEEKEKEGEKKKGSYSVKGNYTIKLKDAEGNDIQEFDGFFEKVHKRRKLSKRGRGYHDWSQITAQERFKVPSEGTYKFYLSYIDETLKDGIITTVYSGGMSLVVAYFLAILALVAASAIDHLLKSKKTNGYFTFAAGAAAGFAFYFHSEATPLTDFNVLASDMFIGGIIGLVFGATFLYGLAPLWTAVNRKLKLSI